MSFHRQLGAPIKIVRPFNNFGPGLSIHDGRVLTKDFAKSVILNKDIELLSNGSPTRTFCYIADAVTGYYSALLGGKAGESYNIGAASPGSP